MILYNFDFLQILLLSLCWFIVNHPWFLIWKRDSNMLTRIFVCTFGQWNLGKATLYSSSVFTRMPLPTTQACTGAAPSLKARNGLQPSGFTCALLIRYHPDGPPVIVSTRIQTARHGPLKGNAKRILFTWLGRRKPPVTAGRAARSAPLSERFFARFSNRKKLEKLTICIHEKKKTCRWNNTVKPFCTVLLFEQFHHP